MTPAPSSRRRCHQPARPHPAAFTLVEVMIAATLGVFVLAGILSSVLLLGRSGARLDCYNTMEQESRKTLEQFAEDARMSSQVAINSPSSVTLTVVDNYASTANEVTYAYDSSTTGPTAKCLYFAAGAAATSPPTILMRNVGSCTFACFDKLGNPTATGALVKIIQLNLSASMTPVTAATATETALSATYLTRN